MNDKIKQLWEISKEQEERFIQELFPEGFINQVEMNEEKLKELFKLIRGAEYRRSKSDEEERFIKMMNEFFEKIRLTIVKRDINNHNWNPESVAGYVFNQWLIKRKELSSSTDNSQETDISADSMNTALCSTSRPDILCKNCGSNRKNHTETIGYCYSRKTMVFEPQEVKT